MSNVTGEFSSVQVCSTPHCISSFFYTQISKYIVGALNAGCNVSVDLHVNTGCIRDIVNRRIYVYSW